MPYAPDPSDSTPLRLPVSEYKTPAPNIVLYSEIVNRRDPAYDLNAPLARGTLYSTIVGAKPEVISAYPELFFLREVRWGNTEDYVIWYWAISETAEDSYNAVIEYTSNYVAAPTFTRSYTVPRWEYDETPSISLDSPLDTITWIEVTDGGANYAATDTVQIDSLSGTGAEATLVVDPNGTIVRVILTNTGSGYTEAPTVTVVSATGAGAVLVGHLQPQDAVLVAQKKQELPDDDPMRNDFVEVTRIYETLPGPYLISSKIDDDGIPIYVNRRHNRQSTIDAITPREYMAGGDWTKLTSEPVNESYFVGWETYETRAIPGNVMTATQIDEDGNPVTVTKQMVETSNVVTSESTTGNCTSGSWIKKYGKPVSDIISNQIIETVSLPGVTTTETQFDKDGNPVTMTKQLKAVSCVTTSETVTGNCVSGSWIKKYGKPVTDSVSHEIIETIALPGVTVESSRFRSDGSTISVRRRLKATSCITEGGNISTGVLTLTRIEEVTDLVSYEVQEDSLVPGPDVHGVHVNETYGIVVDITKTVVEDGTEPTQDLSGNTLTEIKPHDKWQSIQIVSALDLESLPEDVQWYSGQIYSFPPVLVDATLDYAEASQSCCYSLSIDLIANFTQYHGPVKTRVTEQFYNGPPPDDVTIYQFFPEAHDFGFAWFATCGSSDGSCTARTGAPHFHIPLCLHDDLSLPLGLLTTFTFDATVPAALPSGTYIMLPPHVERWRFNVFRRTLTEVYVP